MNIDAQDEKTTAGTIGFYGSLLGSILLAGALLIVFAPLKDSTLDKFVIQHITLFKRVVFAVLFGSLITLICSFYGEGRQRGFGVAISCVNIFFSLVIVGAGE